MRYYSGGYYIIAPTERSDYMDQKLIPEIIVSASECICDQHPDINMFWGTSSQKKYSIKKLRKKYIDETLNISQETYQLIGQWIRDEFEFGFGFPQVFKSLQQAQSFRDLFQSIKKS